MPPLDVAEILVTFVAGTVGFGLFVYGKKAQRVPHLVAGVLLMVYPYFTTTTTQAVGIGTAIALGLWAVIWSGW